MYSICMNTCIHIHTIHICRRVYLQYMYSMFMYSMYMNKRIHIHTIHVCRLVYIQYTLYAYNFQKLKSRHECVDNMYMNVCTHVCTYRRQEWKKYLRCEVVLNVQKWRTHKKKSPVPWRGRPTHKCRIVRRHMPTAQEPKWPLWQYTYRYMYGICMREIGMCMHEREYMYERDRMCVMCVYADVCVCTCTRMCIRMCIAFVMRAICMCMYMHMYMNMHMYMHMYVYVYVHAYMHASCVCVCICTCERTCHIRNRQRSSQSHALLESPRPPPFVCMCVRVERRGGERGGGRLSTYVYVYVYVHVYVYVYVHVYVYVYGYGDGYMHARLGLSLELDIYMSD